MIGDALYPVRTYQVPDKVVTDQSGLVDYQIPPDSHVPRRVVIFDLLRRSTSTTAELQQQFSLNTLPSNSLASQRALERLNLFFPNLYRYASAVGVDSDLPFLNPRQAAPSTPDAKVDYINAVLANFLTDCTVERDSQGIATFSAKFSPPSSIPRAKTLDERPRDRTDQDLLWVYLATGNTSGWSLFDQSLIGPNCWVYVLGQCRMNPKRWVFEFTGFVNTAVQNDERGFISVSITAQDTTKLLHKSLARMNPSIADPAAQTLGKVFGSNYSIFNNPLAGMDLEKIYRYLILGESLAGTPGDPPLGVLDYRLAQQSEIPGIYDARFISASELPSDTTSMTGLMAVSAAARRRRTDSRYSSKLVMWGVSDFVPYRAILPTTQPAFFSSKMVNRLESCREAAHRCMVEFYAGPDGNFYVHPYRHAPKFLTAHCVLGGLPAMEMAPRWDGSLKPTDSYVIESDENLSGSAGLSDDEIVTVLVLTGETPIIGSTQADFLSRRVAVTAPDYLLSRFGFWYREVVEPLINTADESTLKMYALARLAFINKDAYSGNFTLPFRPELQEARPVYFPSRREFGYIMSVTSSYTARGQSVTRISVTFMRKVEAKTIDFTELLVQRNLTASTDPAALQALIAEFLPAAGYDQNADPVMLSPGRPQSVTGTDTSTEVNRIAAESAGLDFSEYVTRLIEASSIKDAREIK